MPKKETNEEAEVKPGRQVTLRDIAKELGVSHVTVSLALRNHPRISETTRTRVKQKAEEMGYHPDPMLSALSHYRLTSKDRPMKATMAWINALREPDKLLKLEEFSRYWKGAETAAKRLGFNLEEFRTADLSLQRMDTIFKTRGIRGLIIAPVLTLKSMPIDWHEFPWQDYAVVRFGRTINAPRLHCITSAQVADAMTAFAKALEKGYKRIGFFGNSSPRRMFSAGYLRAQQALPEDRHLRLLTYEDDPSTRQRDLLANWMKKEKPDAILTDNSLLPVLLEELNYRIPEDIGIATMSIYDTPIDAGIDQNPLEIGRAAVRTLDALLHEHHFGIPLVRNQILVEGRWVDGPMLPDRN